MVQKVPSPSGTTWPPQLRQMRQLRHLCRDLSHRRRSGAVGLLPGADPAQTAGRLRLTCIIPLDKFPPTSLSYPAPTASRMLWVFFVRYAAFFVPVFQNHLTALSLLSFATPVFDRLPQEILHNLCNLPRPVLPFLLLFCTKNPSVFVLTTECPKTLA